MRSPIVREQHFPLSQLAKRLPVRRSKRTLMRWATKGVPDAMRAGTVRLETINVGGVRYSSVEAYYRMVEKANPE